MTLTQAFDLAFQHQQAGRLAEAAVLYQQILAVHPKQAETLHRLGVISYQQGQYEPAITWIRRSLAHYPNCAAAWSNLGESYRGLRRFEEAIGSYQRALQLEPGSPAVHNNLGLALDGLGRRDDALAAFQRAIQLQPDYAEAHSNLGNALSEQHKIDEAIAAYRQALQFNPEFAVAWNNLGIALSERGKLEEAIAAYRRAVEIQPGNAQAHNNLGSALTNEGRLDEAMTALRRALDLQPHYAEAHYNLGNAFKEQGRPDEAVAAYRRALEINPNYAEFHNNLGNVLTDQGRLDAAIAAFRRALQLKPEHAWVHSNLIYTLHFHPGSDEKAITEEQQRWNRQFGEPAKQFIQPHANIHDSERRLRIGYVSPDFRLHAVGLYLAPLLQHHNLHEFEITCYSEVLRPDAMTEKFRDRADHWHSTVGLTDEAFAEMIRRHRVDILVDLTQHMARNRLPMFARQPAPVQVSFAGYPESTGLEAIHYRISDAYLESELGDGRSQIGSELRTPISDLQAAQRLFPVDSYWCYDPCGIEIEVNSLPAQESGHLTFGCLNNFCKVNEPLLVTWARVLGNVQDSRLMLLSRVGSHRQRTLEILQREGIEPHRVEFVDLRPRPEYFALYHRLDIALDPFPYNGHTTSLDALWMGVPVVSRAASRAVGRAGLSQLSTLGLPELVASSEEEYIGIATQLAHNLPRLAELRKTLRPRMQSSPLVDAPRFARDIEDAYRAMWRQWCAAPLL